LPKIQRFAADVSSNAALRAEAEKAYAQASQATPVDGVIAASELRVHAKAKA
jgi:hypothetical protein